MGPKKQAILDIKEELKQLQKCFISFNKKLNPAINELLKEYSKEQNAIMK